MPDHTHPQKLAVRTALIDDREQGFMYTFRSSWEMESRVDSRITLYEFVLKAA
jgi:hypothetical protein